MILEFGWAYGPEGNALVGKTAMNVITTGGSKDVYCSEGNNNYTVNEFLRPMEQTARLCGMHYLPPFAVMGTHQLSQEALGEHTAQYMHLISLLQGDLATEELRDCYFINDIAELKNIKAS